MHARATVLTWLSNDRRQSSTTPRTFISSETVRSAPATDTEDMVDVAACSWVAVPIARTSDLSGLSYRPFCKYHCLTSAVHAARTASPSVVLSACIDRCSCVSSADWWYLTPCCEMTSATGQQYTANNIGPSTEP